MKWLVLVLAVGQVASAQLEWRFESVQQRLIGVRVQDSVTTKTASCMSMHWCREMGEELGTHCYADERAFRMDYWQGTFYVPVSGAYGIWVSTANTPEGANFLQWSLVPQWSPYFCVDWSTAAQFGTSWQPADALTCIPTGNVTQDADDCAMHECHPMVLHRSYRPSGWGEGNREGSGLGGFWVPGAGAMVEVTWQWFEEPEGMWQSWFWPSPAMAGRVADWVHRWRWLGPWGQALGVELIGEAAGRAGVDYDFQLPDGTVCPAPGKGLLAPWLGVFRLLMACVVWAIFGLGVVRWGMGRFSL